jgi:hypothetical protein
MTESMIEEQINKICDENRVFSAKLGSGSFVR